MELLKFTEMLRNSNTLCVSDKEFEDALNKSSRESRQPAREGIECEKCGNWEFVWVVHDGLRMTRECECKTARNNFCRVRKSGLSAMLEKSTFESFQTISEWQKIMKEKFLQFCRDKDRGWLLVSGQPGCGKTHLCTAAAGKFIRAGADTRYMRWVDESTALKSYINDDYEYRKRIDPLKTCKVLYIDDFWKTQAGKSPSPADVKLAFEILDYRYCNPGLVTMISTERTVQDLIDIDQAVGSRIYEKTKKYCLEFSYSPDKNWRLR